MFNTRKLYMQNSFTFIRSFHPLSEIGMPFQMQQKIQNPWNPFENPFCNFGEIEDHFPFFF